MQPVAQQWLVWQMTGSMQMLGWLTFCLQLPSLFLGAWAGSVTDRVSRKKVVLVALSVAGLQASALAILALTGLARPTHVLLLALLLGLTHPFEIPARQAMLAELAGDDLPNMVALNSTLVTVMRILGPSLGGLVTAWWGAGWCFAINAVSFLAVIAAVVALPTASAPPRDRAPGVPISEAVRWVWREPTMRALFILLVGLSTFGLAWGTLMPGWVATVLKGEADTLGHLLSFAGMGALLAAVLMVLAETGLAWRIGVGGVLMASGLAGLSVSTHTGTAALALFIVGLGQVTQSAGILSELHQRSPPALRGRLLGLFTMASVGMTPLGGLGASWLADRLGAPLAIRCLAALVALSAALYLGQWARASLKGAPARG
jgi:MFS family permease